jgi:hypothetical protein
VVALLLTALVAVTPTAGPAIRIVSQQARWTGLAPADALSDDRQPWFLISGEIENAGPHAVRDVRLIYELLSDDQVVAREMGYNRRAEPLRNPQVESGSVDSATLRIEPIASHQRDTFRMLFIRSEVPRFDRWRVRIDRADPVAAPHR